MTGEEDEVVEVVAGSPGEYRFAPERIEVGAGMRIGVVFTNTGEIPHEFVVEAVGFHLHADPGETVEGAFVVPEEGTYTFGCYLPVHIEAGMRGDLVVRAA